MGQNRREPAEMQANSRELMGQTELRSHGKDQGSNP
jgi:hypothetical protein